ncbi:Conserved_hypothetical protein [Hexamita inflata]|uniref:Uncharacterized protein n=1 Tax=Hexamita inflata TaxID=28002 RepID=A0AA86PEV2_9EUKA|nr:Conserved hypothetical protein [Hexamita inflata]
MEDLLAKSIKLLNQKSIYNKTDSQIKSTVQLLYQFVFDSQKIRPNILKLIRFCDEVDPTGFQKLFILIQKLREEYLNKMYRDSLRTIQQGLQLWEVELLFLVYYVSNYILKYFATSNADDKFQQIISSWRLFMNYSLTQEGQKYDFDRIRPQSTIQSRYLIFQKGKIEITTCNKRTAMTKINAVEDVQGRSTNSLNKLRQF